MLRKPSPLRAGDTVALVAPSGACDPARVREGAALLESWDLRVVPLREACSVRYLAARDDERARLLSEALQRDDVAAVLPVRGGFGAARLHGLLDLRAAVAGPKIVVGFSDASLLLNRLVSEARMVSYHGPMVGADLPRLPSHAQERFRRFLFGEDGWWEGAGCATWREGTAEGRLVGGCLSVLVTTLGTPYEIDTNGAILFLEDVAEKPYRIDRMLTHLAHAGKLRGVRGVLVGSMLDCDDGEGTQTLRDIFLDAVSHPDVPIVFGFQAGHGSENVVLPLGCRARLVGADARLDLLEPVFA